MSTKEVIEKSADEETDWLYGDDNFDEEETTEKEVFSALIGDVDGVSGLNYQESESDSDDDVCVTIGDIKTGGSQGSSFGSSSISLNIKTSVSGSKSRGLDLDAEGNVLQVDVESFEEKPWRKPGADLSDYFNYGFNEDTWKAYCDKQRRLRMSLEILSLGSLSKIMVHQSSSSDLSEHSTRKSSGAINVIGGQAGTISRVEGRRRHSADENNIQVVSEQSSDTELSSPKLLPFFPPNIPPPPFPPPSISTTLPLIPPPGFPLPPGAPPPMIPPLDSEEERVSRHRDHRHHGSERYQESLGKEGVRDRHRERRHRDRNEQHRSSRSGSSRRRHDSDDADSHRRHRHKRSKHNRGSLEPSEECNVDQENQSEATE
ncbi:pre-mRNA 3'-end-processing factor FIP1-like [Sinocyclocheilus grahami]|uniref:pre-mRNA 3'-end-processing factor FIP1-like n=1 Tax=Sinocyclocheilus grahami TaxID=75366 RepID=UPI0007AC5369|nr:PREDICTED: pre-mRNA 3'-end-processing factor FIP1-like [Sinocyclocheilus grahami]